MPPLPSVIPCSRMLIITSQPHQYSPPACQFPLPHFAGRHPTPYPPRAPAACQSHPATSFASSTPVFLPVPQSHTPGPPHTPVRAASRHTRLLLQLAAHRTLRPPARLSRCGRPQKACTLRPPHEGLARCGRSQKAHTLRPLTKGSHAATAHKRLVRCGRPQKAHTLRPLTKGSHAAAAHKRLVRCGRPTKGSYAAAAHKRLARCGRPQKARALAQPTKGSHAGAAHEGLVRCGSQCSCVRTFLIVALSRRSCSFVGSSSVRPPSKARNARARKRCTPSTPRVLHTCGEQEVAR
eukprot:365306-Chlamydomonas_euryale.AAC.11